MKLNIVHVVNILSAYFDTRFDILKEKNVIDVKILDIKIAYLLSKNIYTKFKQRFSKRFKEYHQIIIIYLYDIFQCIKSYKYFVDIRKQ